MDKIPDEYCGNRSIAVLRRLDGNSWEYYVRIGDSIQAIEKDIEERRTTYGFPYVRTPAEDIAEEKDKFLAKFEQVNASFLDLVLEKVYALNQSKTAKTTPLDCISVDDILAMQRKERTAKNSAR
ncbi:MAG: hypothetical protein QXT19_03575 [Candidatus Woesearchaeota archaeon]